MTAKAPFTDLIACQPGANTDQCAHNEYSPPEVDTSGAQDQLKGVYPSQLLGYRWDARHGRFVQIPFQVDKVFTRYLENDASGFAIYSGADQPSGVAVDGRKDTVFGNLDDPCNDNYNGQNEGTGTSPPMAGIDPNQTYRQLYQGVGICSSPWPYHQSVNLADPTFEGLNALSG